MYNGELVKRCAVCLIVVITDCFAYDPTVGRCELLAKKPQPTPANMTIDQETVDRLFGINSGRYGEWREFSTHSGGRYRICHYTDKIFLNFRTGESLELKLDGITQDMVSKYPVKVEYDPDDIKWGAIELTRFTVLDP